MAQGLFGGATSYEEQSLSDILKDIESWESYTEEIHKYLTVSREKLVSVNYWKNIPFDFQSTLITTLRYCDTIIEDFSRIKKAIEEDNITKLEINLLRKIGRKSIEYNREYGQTYKDDYRWKDYENSNFRIAEDMYAKGRDFFVTLQDASNAAARMEDYMKEKKTENSINISGNASNVQIQQNTSHSNQQQIIETNAFDTETINETIAQLENSIDELGLSSSDKQELIDKIVEVKVLVEKKDKKEIKSILVGISLASKGAVQLICELLGKI